MINQLFSRFEYRGYTFLSGKGQFDFSDDYKIAVIKDCEFLNVDTNSESEDRQLAHGHYSGYTRNYTRSIVLTIGVFCANESERIKKIKEMDALFQPPQNPDSDNLGYYDFRFTLHDNTYYGSQAKVVERPTYENYNNGKRVDFTVELLVIDDTCMYGAIQTLNDTNHSMGMSFEETLGFPLRYQGGQVVTYAGVSQAPVSCTITATQDIATAGYILVRSIATNKTLLYINNIQLSIGDKIIVDSKAKRTFVLRNGFVERQDITASLNFPYDVYPSLVGGNTQLVVDTGLMTETVEVVRSFQDTRC